MNGLFWAIIFALLGSHIFTLIFIRFLWSELTGLRDRYIDTLFWLSKIFPQQETNESEDDGTGDPAPKV